MHGGKSPQAQRSARERLAALVDPAITTLSRVVRHGRPDAVALGAARDVLDRAGLKAATRLELSGTVRLDGLRARLDAMGAEKGARLAELLGHGALDAEEQGELTRLRAEAGLAAEGAED